MATYTLPDHILNYFDTQRLQYGQEWQVTPDGVVLLRMDRKVYNLTQDTTMQIGTLQDRRCIEDCPYYYEESIRISQNGQFVFAQGEDYEQNNDNIKMSIISAWDIETGRWLYDVYGSWNDRLFLSSDE